MHVGWNVTVKCGCGSLSRHRGDVHLQYAREFAFHVDCRACGRRNLHKFPIPKVNERILDEDGLTCIRQFAA